MSYESLRSLLKELRFNGMLAHLDDAMTVADRDHRSVIDVLTGFLEIEKAHRQTRSLAYRLELARLSQRRLNMRNMRLVMVRGVYACSSARRCLNHLLIKGRALTL
jgi:hypothetical protein